MRLYKKDELLNSWGLSDTPVDPLSPCEKEALRFPCPLGGGVYVNDVLQMYGCLSVYGQDLKLIIGPTALHLWNKDAAESYIKRFNLEDERRERFIDKLKNFPRLTYEKLIWLLRLFDAAVNGSLSTDTDLPEGFTNSKEQLERINADVTFKEDFEEGQINKESTYDYEREIISYIKSGQPEKLKQLFASTLNIKSGRMASDMLRQTRNMFICGTTLASRAAVDGGLDSSTAFRLSDIYIQKIEAENDPNAIMRMIYDMMIDYAERTKRAAFTGGGGSMLVKKCGRYIMNNITRPIRAAELAEHLGISPSYLCSAFKQQTGVTLSSYIASKKIEEAVRLLEFSDKSLSEIAEHLGFCSQSHFQNVFKKATGRTPRSYRS